MTRLDERYIETVAKLLRDYAYAGIQAVSPVPDFLVETSKLPDPSYNIVFRQAGVMCSLYGTYTEHTLYLARLTKGK